MPESPRTHFTAKELAQYSLPGLPKSERGIQLAAKRDRWPYIRHQGRGGGKEYALSSLPEAARKTLIAKLAGPLLPAPVPENLPVADVEPAPSTPAQILPTLKGWQTRAMDARMAFIRAIQRLEPATGVTKAIEGLVENSRAGSLPDDLQRLVSLANARSGKEGSRTLSKRTLFAWWSDFKKIGHYTAVAPQTVEKTRIPAWVPSFMKLYQTPQKPSIAACLEDLRALAPQGLKLPTESQARRFLKKYSRLEVQRGRRTASELKSQRLYRQRDTSGFFPTDIAVCDGHTFKAYVAHPFHGRPFKPEVCAVIDAVTRVVMGWSAGLAESAHTVADAIRHACLPTSEKPMGGLPLILYADQGSGNKAKVNTDELSGLFPRLGIEFTTGRPGNPQGRGIVERLQATLWIRAAKKLETYCGKDMDTAAARKVYLTLQKDVREAARTGLENPSEMLLSWAQFLDFCRDQVEAYNHRPHTAHPRITDPETGLRRHMTPAEMWGKFVSEGWAPTLLEEWEIESLFRPHETVITRRGTIRLFKNVYSDPVLEHYHGEKLQVGYDIHDPSRVWVRDEESRLIVVAKLDAHKSKFMPVARVDQLREERCQRRTEVVERKLEEIELERRGGAIEAKPLPLRIELDPEVEARAGQIRADHERKISDQRQYRLVENTLDAYNALKQERAEGRKLTAKEQQWMSEVEGFWRGEGKSGLFKSGWQPFAERNRKLMEEKRQAENQ